MATNNANQKKKEPLPPPKLLLNTPNLSAHAATQTTLPKANIRRIMKLNDQVCNISAVRIGL
jgi:hypothetical protein